MYSNIVGKIKNPAKVMIANEEYHHISSKNSGV